MRGKANPSTRGEGGYFAGQKLLNFFSRIKSVIDGTPMDGIHSIRIRKSGPEAAGDKHLVRWTELFLLPTRDQRATEGEYDGGPGQDETARAAGVIAKAVCVALVPHLEKLKEADLSPLAVRVNLDPENVSSF